MLKSHAQYLDEVILWFKNRHKSNHIVNSKHQCGEHYSGATVDILIGTLATAAGLDDPRDLTIGHITTMLARFRREDEED